MIAQQYVDRISFRFRRYPDFSGLLASAEGLLRGIAIAIIALAFVFGCIRGAASLTRREIPTVKVTVKPGDTIWKYASRYGDKDRYILSRVQDISKLNNLSGSTPIQPGTELVVPK